MYSLLGYNINKLSAFSLKLREKSDVRVSNKYHDSTVLDQIESNKQNRHNDTIEWSAILKSGNA